MVIDIVVIMYSMAEVILHVLNGNASSGIVWGGVLVYATLNLVENFLRRSGRWD